MNKKITRVIVRGKRGSDSILALKSKLDKYDSRITYEVEYADYLPRCNFTVFFSDGKQITLYGQPRLEQLHEIFNPDYING